ncbi:hypothetical protein ACFQ3Z_21595 [Streptomyces nogalater]
MATTFQKCKKDKDDPCIKSRCGHPWTVRYREPGGRSGRQREKTFPTKKQAEAHGNQMEADKLQGVYLDPERGRSPFVHGGTSGLAPRCSGRTLCGTTRGLRPTT